MTRYSDNGWPDLDRGKAKSTLVPGTTLHIVTAPDAAWILAEFAQRFNAEVESLAGKVLDDWSYANRNVRGSLLHLSCHATGTAIDLNALQHPRGVRHTYSARKMKALRALLKDFTDPDSGQCVIKWGGDFGWPSTVDEMHFQIRGDKHALARVQLALEDTVTEKDKADIVDAVMAKIEALFTKSLLVNNQVLPGDDPKQKDFTIVGALSNIEKNQDQGNKIINLIHAAMSPPAVK